MTTLPEYKLQCLGDIYEIWSDKYFKHDVLLDLSLLKDRNYSRLQSFTQKKKCILYHNKQI